jgi:hypothetical protein
MSFASTAAGRIGRPPARRHLDGIELDDDRADLIEDESRPGEIRR